MNKAGVLITLVVFLVLIIQVATASIIYFVGEPRTPRIVSAEN